MFHCKFVFQDTDNLIAGMYSLDVFVKKSSTRCEKNWTFCQNLTSDR